MTSQEFVQITGAFLSESEDFQYFVQLLHKIEPLHRQVQSLVAQLVHTQNSSQVISGHGELRRTLSAVAEGVRDNFSTQRVWTGVAQFRLALASFRAAPISPELAHQIDSRLIQFSDSYEQFIKTYDPQDTFQLLEKGNILHQSLDCMQFLALSARNALNPALDLNEGEAEIDLFFVSAPTVNEFADKLSSLVVLYDEICALLSISTAAKPLRIGKIESGSWFGRLIGSAPATGIMSRLIERAAHFLYENFTTQGQINTLPRSADALEHVLELKKHLEENGIPTVGMEANIAKSAVLLSQKLTSLLGGEPKVVINAVEISVGGEMINAQLGGNRTLRLETGTLPKSPSGKKKRRRQIDREDK
jgi:hypothetical protein